MNVTTKKKRNADLVQHRDDAVKHVHTPLIQWHGPTGTIFSVDIQPQRPGMSCQRVATAGSDSRIQIWELVDDQNGLGSVQHLSELNRHDCSINVAKFHPREDLLASASDDRCLFIWRLDDVAGGAPDIFAEQKEDEIINKETWNVIKQIRGHGSEVYDLAWSPCGQKIVCGTMDNTSYVWDITNGKKLALWQHHKGYVQGVCWDPHNKFITTLSSDRSVMIYGVQKLTLLQKIYNMETQHKRGDDKNRSIRIFLDPSMVDTFFRRPAISPDGKILALPTGCYEIEAENVTDDTAPEDRTILINVVYLFNYNNFDQPALCLPTGSSPAIAVRFCPKLFQLRRKDLTEEKSALFSLPYRMIFCVVTLDSILLYDTQQAVPFASIENIHYEQLTDASWSSDAKFLMVSSVDGFCTIISMNLDRLDSAYAANNNNADEQKQ